RSHLLFRRQLIQVGGILLTVLLGILLIPAFSGEVRGQLLGLYGIIVSATIALSSTTLVGNVMAGIMLRTIGSFKAGDYITVDSYFGRVSEMDLLHVEIQTEERDLTTLPNLFVVTRPVRVMHSAGTVLTVDLSLGYDVSRHHIEQLLKEAATASGLESPYVQIRELGDFSVTYAISGLLQEVNQVIGKRRELRGRIVDTLHGAGVEIVSPTFMNTRAFDPASRFIPDGHDDAEAEETAAPDSLVFDKAEKAESVERLRSQLDELQKRLKECEQVAETASAENKKEAAREECRSLNERIERLQSLIERREAQILDG
ncbi:MAG: mechanosensitive ion channel domain-containing protein, partial [Pseudomonadota bacterium]